MHPAQPQGCPNCVKTWKTPPSLARYASPWLPATATDVAGGDQEAAVGQEREPRERSLLVRVPRRAPRLARGVVVDLSAFLFTKDGELVWKSRTRHPLGLGFPPPTNVEPAKLFLTFPTRPERRARQ